MIVAAVAKSAIQIIPNENTTGPATKRLGSSPNT